MRIVPVNQCSPEAIRSVTHLGLARLRPMVWWPQFEPKGAGRTAPALAPSGSVFLVNQVIATRVGFGKRVRPPVRRPPRRFRGQKTFSAGPCSFSTGELWFPGRAPRAPKVQPVFDSRHGRITAKAFSLPLVKEQRAAASNQSNRAQGPTPFTGWRPLSKSGCLHRSVNF
jgi:hypothetical protein